MEGSVQRIRFQIIDGDARSRKVILQHYNAKYAERTLARVIRQYPSTLKLKVVE